ncbi:MAG: glycyl-tRNA synthetase beta chain [Moritella dasanensis]|jgi:glycyl-tRNA synthetase beta chain
MATENLLIEIGTEELPPKSLRTLAEAFAANFQAELKKAGLEFADVSWMAAPRRLALTVSALADSQADKVIEKRGPAVSVAFDADGNATKAAQGWARGNGITVEQAGRIKTDKGEWLLHKSEVKGQSTQTLVADMVATSLAKLPVSKPMRWGDSPIQFIRPVHTITMLFGAEALAGEILGIKAARTIRGHRFLGKGDFELPHADNYVDMLEDHGMVMVDYERRKDVIRKQVIAAASEHGGVAEIEEDLLEEVTSLVEWPVTLVGNFEERYLNVPAEALIYTMKDNQKYFPMLSTDGELLPKFIFVSNIISKDVRRVIEGNEKVVRPRLADAEFFFNTDKKRTLASRLADLESVLFQKQLGTLKEKSQRIADLAAAIAGKISANTEHAQRAGLLAKADLMSDMVVEFPDVQGVMGMHYARNDGEAEEVAIALNEQYMPRYAGDRLPESLVACSVALADKLDTLVGIFGIGQIPKGDKDPFALRRAAIGTLRIIIEKDLPLDLVDLVDTAKVLFGDKLSNQNVSTDVVAFVLGRFPAWYRDAGISVDVIQAVLARRPTKPADFDKRVKAVNHFRSLDASATLAAANKRVGNILAKFEGELNATVDASLLQEDAEKALASAVAAKVELLAPLFAAGDYQQALTELSELRDVVDTFFDNVMVMADDEALKINRLTLLNTLRNQFLNVADISVLQK